MPSISAMGGVAAIVGGFALAYMGFSPALAVGALTLGAVAL